VTAMTSDFLTGASITVEGGQHLVQAGSRLIDRAEDP